MTILQSSSDCGTHEMSSIPKDNTKVSFCRQSDDGKTNIYWSLKDISN